MARCLLILCNVDLGVIATAEELFDCRQYPGVVAVASDALEGEPECIPLLLVRARAHIALRRDLDAQADLRDIIRLDAACGLAFRLLGELAARRNENDSAAIFFREALRLDPDDREAADWLLIVDAQLRSATAAQQIPAPAAVAGRFPAYRDPTPVTPPRRFAHGTRSPDEERPTQPFPRGSDRGGSEWKTPAPLPVVVAPPPAPTPRPTLHGRPATQPPAKVAPRLARRPTTTRSAAIPELPGFGEYLVAAGILSRERLRAAQAYQRSMKVQLATAVVTLGLATPQRIEWAAVAHQSELARARHA